MRVQADEHGTRPPEQRNQLGVVLFAERVDHRELRCGALAETSRRGRQGASQRCPLATPLGRAGTPVAAPANATRLVARRAR